MVNIIHNNNNHKIDSALDVYTEINGVFFNPFLTGVGQVSVIP